MAVVILAISKEKESKKANKQMACTISTPSNLPRLLWKTVNESI